MRWCPAKEMRRLAVERKSSYAVDTHHGEAAGRGTDRDASNRRSKIRLREGVVLQSIHDRDALEAVGGVVVRGVVDERHSGAW